MIEAISKIHFGAVVAIMIQELGSWSWEKPFCVAVFAFFIVGLVPQFILLRMKWKPWLISVTLGALVVLCDFCAICMPGTAHDLLSLLEMFFISALVGAGLAGALHIFWEIFKKRDEDDDSVWMLRKSDEKDEMTE